MNDTQGPVETLNFGIEYILENKLNSNLKTLVIDCDTFYTQDIIQMFSSINSNGVFYVNRYNEQPLYSYIDLDKNR